MKTTLKLASAALLLSGFVTLAGSSSDDNGSSSAIAPPPNAIVLDETNAKTTAEAAIGTTEMLLSKDTSQTASAGNIIGQVLDQIRDNKRNSGVDLVAGIAYNDTWNCTTYADATAGDPNTITEKGNYTDNETGGSDSGTVTFVSCDFSGIILDGKISYNGSWSNIDGRYTDNASGNLTMTTGGQTIALKSFSFKETGNDFNGDYITSVMQYIFDPGTDGFAVKTTTPLEGNWFTGCGYPTAGVILISGGDNTYVRATFGAGGILTIEADTGDGVFTEVTGSPVSMCL